MPRRTTPIAARRPLAPAARLAALTTALLAAGIAVAGPALAIEDPSRPDARITQAPSCHPGGLVVEVTAGTVPYSVRLASTRTPSGEDAATLQPGQSVALHTGEVAWGETIDSRLEYAALDGSGIAYVDELETYSFTRPTEQDCAAIAPTGGGVGAPVVPADTGGGTVSDGGPPPPAAAAGTVRLNAQVATVAESRGVTSWPLSLAGWLTLLGSAAALVLVGIRWWSPGRRP